MTAIDRELRAIISAEAASVRPPAGARERGWARLAGAVAAGEVPDDIEDTDDIDTVASAQIPASAPRRRPWLRIVPLVVLIVGGLGLLARSTDEPVVAATIAADDDVGVPAAPRVIVIPRILVTPTPAPVASVTPRRSPPRAPAAADEDSFAAELRLLAEAQAEIQRGAVKAGLELLRSHARRYPAGHFAQDREALTAIARCDSGAGKGREIGERFLRAHPASIHVDHVRSACGL